MSPENNNIQINFQYLDLESCFKNFYLVPDYQREYVWGERQVNQLLNDLFDEYNNNPKKEYFIGSTVVFKRDDARYELIDGQQRTTTLFIMICAFRTIYEERGLSTKVLDAMIKYPAMDESGNEVDRFKLELQYETSSNVLSDISINKIPEDTKNGSEEKLFKAYRYVQIFLRNNFLIESRENETEEERVVNAQKSNELLKKFFVYVSRKLKFIQIETPEINDALKIFETINERGIGLNPMDLLKNLIFRQVSRDEFSKLKDKWKEVIKKLESNNEKPLRFLRYFLMANYPIDNERGDDILREDEIYHWITKSENAAKCNYIKKPFEFVELMSNDLDLYIKFFKGEDKNGSNVYLNNIRKLGGGSFRQHLVLLLAVRHLPTELFNHFAKQLEVLIFNYFITGVQAKIYERNFSKWAKQLKEIRTKDDLNAFIVDELKQEVTSMEVNYKNRFQQLHYWALQQYRLRYILAKITQYIDQERLGSYVPQNLDVYITKGVEIEHILPNTPSEELITSFGDDYHEYKNMLGNLTLLEKSINSSIGNGDFYNVKAKEYLKSQFYITKSISAIENVGANTAINRTNEKLQSYSDWDKESIVSRQNLLYNLSREIWRIEALG